LTAYYPVRACGVEARGEPQHRTQVKPRMGRPSWVSEQGIATPNIQSSWDGGGDGSGGTFCILTLGELIGSHVVGRVGGNDACPTPDEKSDHFILAMKPVKVGGAKGMMG
jgi:hypothetical protein